MSGRHTRLVLQTQIADLDELRHADSAGYVSEQIYSVAQACRDAGSISQFLDRARDEHGTLLALNYTAAPPGILVRSRIIVTGSRMGEFTTYIEGAPGINCKPLADTLREYYRSIGKVIAWSPRRNHDLFPAP
jgi:hypothetical protein